jgi:hypothetical protein
VRIAEEGVTQFRKEHYEVIIVDTSGRHKQVQCRLVQWRGGRCVLFCWVSVGVCVGVDGWVWMSPTHPGWLMWVIVMSERTIAHEAQTQPD